MKVINLFRFMILLLPIWWFLGVTSVIFHVFTLLTFLALLRRKILIPKQLIPLFLFICVYVFSIMINYQEIPSDRLLASLYNLSYWVMGFLIIIIFYNISIEFNELLKLLNSFIVLGVICGLFSLIGSILFFKGYNEVTITTPVSNLFPSFLKKAPLISSSFQFVLLREDYTIFGILRRGGLFFGWPVALGMTMGITISITILYYRIKNKILKSIPFLILQIIGLTYSLSRIATVGLVFSLFLIYYFTLRNRRIVVVNFLFLVMLLIFLFQIPINLILKFEEFREGSAKTRINLYSYIIKSTLDEKPLFGYGVKPREENIDIPLASHSTYLSNFFKAGFTGISLLILFWFIVYKKWYRQIKIIKDDNLLLLHNFIGIIFIQGLIWQLTEDIDATLVVPFLYFIIVGLILSFNKIKVRINYETK